MLLWTRQVHFRQVCQKFSQNPSCCKYKKTTRLCIFKFLKQDKWSSGLRKRSFDNFAQFLLPQGTKFFFKVPEKNKTSENFFPQNVSVVHTSTLLTSLPKSFRKLFFAVSTRIINNCGYFKFSTEKLMFWTRRILFWQPFPLFPTKRLRTFCSKCRSVEKTSNIWRKTIFIRNPALTVNEVLTISMSLFCHNA